MKTTVNHDRLYCIIVAFVAPLTIATAAGLIYWRRKVGGPLGHLSEPALPWFAAANLVYGVAMLATICARRYLPGLGRRLTRLLNWALLPAVPIGTIISLYGFWKVDCGDKH